MENRNIVKRLRLTESENQKLEKILQKNNVTFSEFVREKIFLDDDQQKQKYIKRLKLNETLNQNRAKYDLIDQLKRIGNNLNQISHHLNREKNNPISIQIGIEIQKIRSEIERLKNDS
jgi:hypothetical protein